VAVAAAVVADMEVVVVVEGTLLIIIVSDTLY
jgi:hypothetical protein